MFYPSSAFKCSVIQQPYRSISRSTCSLDFKLTWIQTATNLCCGYNNRRRTGNLSASRHVFVCVRDTAFTVWSAASVSESESQFTEKEYCLMSIHHVLCRTTCCVACGNLSDFSTTVLYTYRAGVRKRRCGEAVWRLSATVSPAYRISLRERRRGENVYTRPSSPLDSQTVGSCR